MLRTAQDFRNHYIDISGEMAWTASTDDSTLVSVRNANYTIFIQRVIVWISTDAAQSMSFEDSNGTPKQIAEIPASPGDSTRWDFDYGDEGLPLTEGKDFKAMVSAAGLAGQLKWYGYQKLTLPVSSLAGASSQ